jgi:HSP90 family molecular chaperone
LSLLTSRVLTLGVNLYSRKVVIEQKPKDLLPGWLRFMKGVVDSEDLPLSIAREKAQDSLLLKKMNDVLTRKVRRRHKHIPPLQWLHCACRS